MPRAHGCAGAVDLDGAPGVGGDELGEVDGELRKRELIGAAIEAGGNPPHSTRIDVDGFVAHALQLQGGEVLLIERVKAQLFDRIHRITSSAVLPGSGQPRTLSQIKGKRQEDGIFPPRSGFVQQADPADVRLVASLLAGRG